MSGWSAILKKARIMGTLYKICDDASNTLLIVFKNNRLKINRIAAGMSRQNENLIAPSPYRPVLKRGLVIK